MDLNAVAGLGAMVKSAARWWDSYDTYADEFNSRMGDGYYTGEDVFGQLAYEYARRAGVSPEEAEARLGRWADTAIQHHNYDVLNKFVADNNDNPEYIENTLGQHFDNLQRSIPGLWGRNGTKRKAESLRRQMYRNGSMTDHPVVHGLTGHQILDRGDAMKRNAVSGIKRQSLDVAQRPVTVPQPPQAPSIQQPTQAPRPVQPQQVQAPQSEADYWENVRKQTDIQMYGVARERDPQTGKLLPPRRPGMAAKVPAVKQASSAGDWAGNTRMRAGRTWKVAKAVAPVVGDMVLNRVAKKYPQTWGSVLQGVSTTAGVTAPAWSPGSPGKLQATHDRAMIARRVDRERAEYEAAQKRQANNSIQR